MNKAIKLFSLCVLCFLCLNQGTAHAQNDETKKDLSSVKQKIKQQKAAIQLTNEQQQRIQQQLKKDDLAIAKTAAKMNETQVKQKQTKEKINKLNQQQRILATKKKQQEDVLAEQIRSAYSAGHHDYLKLLLNQQGPSKVQRTLTYYQYLNDARMTSIENFEQVLIELSKIEQQQQQQAEQLQILVAEQKQQKQAIETKQQERKQTLKSLNSQILSSKQRLNKLEGEEKSLIQTLARIQAQLQKEKELKGLSKLKKKLKWPVQGRIAHSFGTKKQGYLRWKGVLLNAGVGKSIKTIHNGTVLFADWLKGYGLVIVIDHGEGYMSLYGHNQTLLKGVGDRVEIGEPIALVGQSGGQSQSGLYFEIRHKGKPVNPKLWCK
ncbi:peptidoglycan DD-metalloendopeptidase family protein [Thalassotalea fonticola]|uniref:Peptidoglycan DD-metalloendopeptidase family protein n=1 Tax=Thalassotalea fonticola TaxID=3065649 RepID=A0ABZ0GM91_9GAMM|nr:peptidoglycan DD-metalloendopeptidase family protein [Colwelliaceae bacterium S1-1]